MLSNTITPDGYTVDANGAWVVNGVIQTQGTNAASTTTGRYIESDALPNIIMPENGLQGTYHLQRDVYENFKTGSASAGTKEMKYETYYYYNYNGEKFQLGDKNPSLYGPTGKWLIDTTKPDAMYGKTNLRYQYNDGSFAGYGFHSIARYEKTPFIDSDLYGKADKFFTEDGYLIRNSLLENDYYGDGLMKMGCQGGWLDWNY